MGLVSRYLNIGSACVAHVFPSIQFEGMLARRPGVRNVLRLASKDRLGSEAVISKSE
jgi:hypothetical protein